MVTPLLAAAFRISDDLNPIPLMGILRMGSATLCTQLGVKCDTGVVAQATSNFLTTEGEVSRFVKDGLAKMGFPTSSAIWVNVLNLARLTELTTTPVTARKIADGLAIRRKPTIKEATEESPLMGLQKLPLNGALCLA